MSSSAFPGREDAGISVLRISRCPEPLVLPVLKKCLDYVIYCFSWLCVLSGYVLFKEMCIFIVCTPPAPLPHCYNPTLSTPQHRNVITHPHHHPLLHQSQSHLAKLIQSAINMHTGRTSVRVHPRQVDSSSGPHERKDNTK